MTRLLSGSEAGVDVVVKFMQISSETITVFKFFWRLFCSRNKQMSIQFTRNKRNRVPLGTD